MWWWWWGTWPSWSCYSQWYPWSGNHATLHLPAAWPTRSSTRASHTEPRQHVHLWYHTPFHWAYYDQFFPGGRSLANIPPSERPKAKPSRKIDGKGAKKSQLQAALQQHSQQLAQLQQLQQLNQQLQQQVLQQRQLKQQNQATLAALQQNAVANQQQLAALQQNVTQLQVGQVS